MNIFNRLRGSKAAQSEKDTCEMDAIKTTPGERHTLDMDAISKEAEVAHEKVSLDNMAKAVLKVAEVIQERLPDADVEYLVKPTDLCDSADPSALPMHFLFRKDGKPVAAIVINTTNGYRSTNVVKTRLFCQKNKIAYIRMYCDGQWSDWIHGKKSGITGLGLYGESRPLDAQTVEFCKSWIEKKVKNYIQ